jgi:cell division protein FtsB
VTEAAQALAARPRPLRSLAGALLVLLALLLLTAALKGWRDLSHARERAAALEGEVAASTERIEDLKRRIHNLREDPATLERMAREELGLVQSHDVVIVLPAPPADPPAPVSSAAPAP